LFLAFASRSRASSQKNSLPKAAGTLSRPRQAREGGRPRPGPPRSGRAGTRVSDVDASRRESPRPARSSSSLAPRRARCATESLPTPHSALTAPHSPAPHRESLHRRPRHEKGKRGGFAAVYGTARPTHRLSPGVSEVYSPFGGGQCAPCINGVGQVGLNHDGYGPYQGSPQPTHS
jgi:hypothetical protein